MSDTGTITDVPELFLIRRSSLISPTICVVNSDMAWVSRSLPALGLDSRSSCNSAAEPGNSPLTVVIMLFKLSIFPSIVIKLVLPTLSFKCCVEMFGVVCTGDATSGKIVECVDPVNVTFVKVVNFVGDIGFKIGFVTVVEMPLDGLEIIVGIIAGTKEDEH